MENIEDTSQYKQEINKKKITITAGGYSHDFGVGGHGTLIVGSTIKFKQMIHANEDKEIQIIHKNSLSSQNGCNLWLNKSVHVFTVPQILCQGVFSYRNKMLNGHMFRSVNQYFFMYFCVVIY